MQICSLKGIAEELKFIFLFHIWTSQIWISRDLGPSLFSSSDILCPAQSTDFNNIIRHSSHTLIITAFYSLTRIKNDKHGYWRKGLHCSIFENKNFTEQADGQFWAQWNCTTSLAVNQQCLFPAGIGKKFTKKSRCVITAVSTDIKDPINHVFCPFISQCVSELISDDVRTECWETLAVWLPHYWHFSAL